MAGTHAAVAHRGPGAGDDALSERAGELSRIQMRAYAGEIAYEDHVDAPYVVGPRALSLYVMDRSHRRVGRPWHVLGILIFVVVTFAHLVFSKQSFALGWTGWLSTLTLYGVASLLVVKGRPSDQIEDRPLLWLEGMDQWVRVREAPWQDSLASSAPIPFEEIDELLFAVRKVRTPGTSTRVDAFGVFLRLRDGTVWPVIPSTQDREGAYRVAMGVARRVGVGVKQVGQGWSSGGEGTVEVRPSASARPPSQTILTH